MLAEANMMLKTTLCPKWPQNGKENSNTLEKLQLAGSAKLLETDGE